MEEEISRKTLKRNLDPISKDAYAEGAVAGKKSVFQASFDAGYAEGIVFGIKFCIENTLARLSHQTASDRFTEFEDPIKLNCKMCIDNTLETKTLAEIEQFQKRSNANLIQEL